MKKEEDENLRGDVDVADFTAVGFVGFDVNATVGIPQAYGAIFAAAQAILAVRIKPRG